MFWVKPGIYVFLLESKFGNSASENCDSEWVPRMRNCDAIGRSGWNKKIQQPALHEQRMMSFKKMCHEIWIATLKIVPWNFKQQETSKSGHVQFGRRISFSQAATFWPQINVAVNTCGLIQESRSIQGSMVGQCPLKWGPIEWKTCSAHILKKTHENTIL